MTEILRCAQGDTIEILSPTYALSQIHASFFRECIGAAAREDEAD